MWGAVIMITTDGRCRAAMDGLGKMCFRTFWKVKIIKIQTFGIMAGMEKVTLSLYNNNNNMVYSDLVSWNIDEKLVLEYYYI